MERTKIDNTPAAQDKHMVGNEARRSTPAKASAETDATVTNDPPPEIPKPTTTTTTAYFRGHDRAWTIHLYHASSSICTRGPHARLCGVSRLKRVKFLAKKTARFL
jgi:hypothetical protein